MNLYSYCAGLPVGRIDSEGLSFWGWGDDQWIGLSNWFNGRPATDSLGNRVRVGGVWVNLFNYGEPFARENNAMTFNGTVHVRSEASYNEYMSSPWRQYHESYHMNQQGNNVPAFVFMGAWLILQKDGHDKWVAAGRPAGHGGRSGHDFNVLERDADHYADQFVDRKSGRRKHPTSTWGGPPRHR